MNSHLKRSIILGVLTLLLTGFSPFTINEPTVEDGRKAYIKGEFDKAAFLFAKAASDPTLAEEPIVALNLGAALYRLEKYEDAEKAFSAAVASDDIKVRALAFYNLGGAYLAQQKLMEAVEAFSKSLIVDPDNLSTKYNLEYALRQIELQKQQNNECDNPKDGDKNEDSEKEQQKDSEQKKEGSEEQEQQQKSAEQQQEDEKKEQQAAREEDKKQEQQELEQILGSLEEKEMMPLNLQMKMLLDGNKKPDKDW